MKYLWIIRTEGVFGSGHDWKVVTERHDPIEAIEVAKRSSFIIDINGNVRNIISVEFAESVYA